MTVLSDQLSSLIHIAHERLLYSTLPRGSAIRGSQRETAVQAVVYLANGKWR